MISVVCGDKRGFLAVSLHQSTQNAEIHPMPTSTYSFSFILNICISAISGLTQNVDLDEIMRLHPILLEKYGNENLFLPKESIAPLFKK